MGINFYSRTRSTRGVESRPVTYNSIAVPKPRIVEKETDDDGNKLGKDENGKTITRQVEVIEYHTDGVVKTYQEMLDLVTSVGGTEQLALDLFADSFEDYLFSKEVEKDPLDDIMSSLPKEGLDQYKRAVRQLAKALSCTVEEAAVIFVKMKQDTLAAASA